MYLEDHNLVQAHGYKISCDQHNPSNYKSYIYESLNGNSPFDQYFGDWAFKLAQLCKREKTRSKWTMQIIIIIDHLSHQMRGQGTWGILRLFLRTHITIHLWINCQFWLAIIWHKITLFNIETGTRGLC